MSETRRENPGRLPTLPGRDHRELLLFLRGVEADHGGDAGELLARLRDKRRRHWGDHCGTHYDDGGQDGRHDDHDCLRELESWGYIVLEGTGFRPLVRLTDGGLVAAGLLSRARSERQAAGVTHDVLAVLDTEHSVLAARTPTALNRLGRHLREGGPGHALTGGRVRLTTGQALACIGRLRDVFLTIRVEDERGAP